MINRVEISAVIENIISDLHTNRNGHPIIVFTLIQCNKHKRKGLIRINCYACDKVAEKISLQSKKLQNQYALYSGFIQNTFRGAMITVTDVSYA